MKWLRCVLTHFKKYAEIVHFSNGSTVSIHCRVCDRLLYCFIRIPVYQNEGILPAFTTYTIRNRVTPSNTQEEQ